MSPNILCLATRPLPSLKLFAPWHSNLPKHTALGQLTPPILETLVTRASEWAHRRSHLELRSWRIKGATTLTPESITTILPPSLSPHLSSHPSPDLCKSLSLLPSVSLPSVFPSASSVVTRSLVKLQSHIAGTGPTRG